MTKRKNARKREGETRRWADRWVGGTVTSRDHTEDASEATGVSTSPRRSSGHPSEPMWRTLGSLSVRALQR